MTPDEYCQQKAAHSGSSFYYSFLFLPPERRRAITALYAYCREVDDVVDECSEANVARTKLAWWRGQINAIYAVHRAQSSGQQHTNGCDLLSVPLSAVASVSGVTSPRG